MTAIDWKLDYTPADGTTASTTLTEFYDPSVRVKSGSGKDSFEFKVNNIHGDYNLYFTPNSFIKISRRINSADAWSSDDLLMNAAVRKVPQQMDGRRDLLRISGYNYSESVGGVLVFVGGGSAVSIASYLENAVNSAAERNENFALTWHPDNPTLKKDTSTSFPTTNEKSFNKTLNYVLEKYSTNEYTEDGEYFWFVDSENRLVWRPKESEASYTFDESTEEHKSIKITKDTKDVKNYVIVKGGSDPNNNPIQAYVSDPASINKHGFKYYIFTDEKVTAQNNLNADLDSAGVDDMKDANFGTFVATWGDGDSFASYNAYVAAFRTYHKDYIKGLGRAYMSIRKDGKLKVDITYQAGMKEWTLGQVIDVTISSLYISTSPMRVDEIQYTTTTDTFTLIEDEGTI